MEEEDIKILEEFIKEPQAEYEEVYVDGKLISKLELLPIDFKPTKEVSQAIQNLLKAYKQDEKMIDLMASYIWKYDCCEYEISKDLKCEGYYLEEDCKEKCIKEYFRKQVETNE